MHLFTDLRIRTQLIIVVSIVLLVLAGTVLSYNTYITWQTGMQELEEIRTRTLNERKNKLWDNVNFAYKTLESHHAQAGDPVWLEERYGPDLHRVMDLAESTVKESIEKARNGSLSGTVAREEALRTLDGMRYDEGSGFLWVCDTGDPIPRLLLYPVDPGKEGVVADDESFSVINTVAGSISDGGTEGLNLFAAARDAAGRDGEAFFFYEWPKLQPDGRYRDRPMLTHVRAIPEWGWIIGTSMHVDRAMDEAKAASVETLRNMRFDNGDGYFWLTDTHTPYPSMIMDAGRPELEGSVLEGTEFNIIGEEEKNVFLAFMEMTDIGGSGYLQFQWPKPGEDNAGWPMTKEAFVRPFEPWNWIIGSGIYLDDILIAEEQGREEMMKRITRTIIVSLIIAGAAVLISLFALSLIIRKITRPIEETVLWSNNLADGDLTGRLSVAGSREIRRQGQNLNQAVESISSLMERIKQLTVSADDVKDHLTDSARQTGIAFTQVSENLDQVKDRFSRMDESIGDSGTAVSRISSNIIKLESRIDQQAAAVEQSTAAIEEILASLNNVARTSAEKSKSISGLKDILTDCRGRFSTMNEGIANLEKAGKDMDEMASVISRIASRTNLLSMNASIEAAHAGDSGRGFAVVAQEMGKLAASAGGSARAIKTTLSRDVTEIAMLAEESSHMNRIYSTMENEVGTMAETLAEISAAMTEISAGSREILESVSTLREISTEVLSGSREMSSGNEVVSRTISGVSGLSGEVAGAISEVLNRTGDISTAITELDGQVRRIVESINSIAREVSRFRT